MKKLFIVQYTGGSSAGMGLISLLSSSGSQLYVIADSYDEAAHKAIVHLQQKASNRSIFDENGSLRLNELEFKITSIQVIEDFVY